MEYFIKDETWMLNPNEKVVKGITKGVERNDGHCPCQLGDTSKDTKCMCNSFKEEINNIIYGEVECPCGRYIATIQND